MEQGQWLVFFVLLGCGSFVQLFPVVTSKKQVNYMTTVFIFAGLFLLPPGAVSFLIVLASSPEWVRSRLVWYKRLFNTANLLVSALLARSACVLVFGGIYLSAGSVQGLLAAVLAVIVFTLVSHLLLSIVLWLAHGHSWSVTGLFSPDSLLTDVALVSVGVVTALVWNASPWMIALVAAPLFLCYRALKTPHLQEMARIDSKTGLYNAGHFAEELREEFKRAVRFNRPLAVIMADMDLLRNINNTYGHLAGDVVLRGVADIIREQLREYDLAARFGGEEYAILLPETDSERAFAVAERIRSEVEAARFVVTTSPHPIKASLSLGVASFPLHGAEPNEVIYQADLAVYYAKLCGRNRVWVCSPESMALGALAASGRPMDRAYDVVPGFDSSVGQNGDGGKGDQTVLPHDGGQANVAHGGAMGCRRREVSLGAVSNIPRPSLEDRVQATGTRDDRVEVQSDPEEDGPLTWPFVLFVGALILGTLTLWVTQRPWEARIDWIDLFAIALLTGVAHSVPIDAYWVGRISTSSILVLAGSALFGLPGALMLAMAVALVQWGWSRGSFRGLLLDLGTLSLSAAASAFVYQSVPGLLPNAGSLSLVVAALMAGLAYFLTNAWFLVKMAGLSGYVAPQISGRELPRWPVVHYLVYGSLSLLAVLTYQAVGFYGLAAVFLPLLMLGYLMEQSIDNTRKDVAEVKRENACLVKEKEAAKSSLRELRGTYDATLEALLAALDSRDVEEEGHSRRVVGCATAIGRQMGLSESEMAGLVNGALLHDVGKISVSDAILKKTGPLSEGEWQVMMTHSEVGYRMLQHIGFLRDALPVIRHHHERYDGGGYPDGLKGDHIPVGARIFAVADAFDAMTSERPYRLVCSVEVAREEIARCSGAQFDPRVVEAFLNVDPRELLFSDDVSSSSDDPPEEWWFPIGRPSGGGLGLVG